MKTTTLLVLALAGLMLLTAAPSATALQFKAPPPPDVPCEPTPPASSGGVMGFVEGALHSGTTTACNEYDNARELADFVYGETVKEIQGLIGIVSPFVDERQAFACAVVYGPADPEPDPEPENTLCKEIVVGDSL